MVHKSSQASSILGKKKCWPIKLASFNSHEQCIYTIYGGFDSTFVELILDRTDFIGIDLVIIDFEDKDFDKK